SITCSSESLLSACTVIDVTKLITTNIIALKILIIPTFFIVPVYILNPLYLLFILCLCISHFYYLRISLLLTYLFLHLNLSDFSHPFASLLYLYSSTLLLPLIPYTITLKFSPCFTRFPSIFPLSNALLSSFP